MMFGWFGLVCLVCIIFSTAGRATTLKQPLRWRGQSARTRMLNIMHRPSVRSVEDPQNAFEFCQKLNAAQHIRSQARLDEVGCTSNLRLSKASPPRWQSFNQRKTKERQNPVEPPTAHRELEKESQPVPRGSHQMGLHLGEWKMPVVREDTTLPRKQDTFGLVRPEHRPRDRRHRRQKAAA